MLAVVWEVGEERFATDASEVVEVVPVVELHRVSGMPEWVLGLGDYHGRLVPILDAAWLVDRPRPAARLGSRVLVLEVSVRGERRLVGLQVGSLHGVASIDLGDQAGHRGFRSETRPHLAEVVRLGEQTAQRFVLSRFLEGAAGERLFGGEWIGTESDAAAAAGGDAGS